ncbi:hypothetical protein A2U01_0117785, partial [Trifolium medium]|nr:hypothetical protein [Trifolium medium]
APPNGLINYQPPTTDLQKPVGLKNSLPRVSAPPSQPEPIVIPETPRLHPPRRSRPPPMM